MIDNSDWNVWEESHAMLEEMGFCPECGDHMPCGCEDCDFDEFVKDLDLN